MSIVADIVCLSHLRWDFVWQRPQHLLRRAARGTRVFYVEEPVEDTSHPHLQVRSPSQGVTVVVPHFPEGLYGTAAASVQARLLTNFFAESDIDEYVLWYYTPMALHFTEDLDPVPRRLPNTLPRASPSSRRPSARSFDHIGTRDWFGSRTIPTHSYMRLRMP